MKKDNIDIVVEKRTKGKWFHLPVTDKGKQIPILTDAANETIVCFIGIKGQPNEANAAFICKAVNEYDNLKEHIDSLKNKIEVYFAICEHQEIENNLLKNQNKCLLEALQGITDKVEKLALWDKTDAAYYKAKEAIKANETI